jgi:hypothetical protein
VKLFAFFRFPEGDRSGAEAVSHAVLLLVFLVTVSPTDPDLLTGKIYREVGGFEERAVLGIRPHGIKELAGVGWFADGLFGRHRSLILQVQVVQHRRDIECG